MNPATRTLGKLASPLFNIGLGQIPGVWRLYKAVWQYFGPKGICLTKVDDFSIYVICQDWAVSPTILFTHVWEPAETLICKKHIKEGMTVIDAGAYIGYYSILASKLVGNSGKIYAFEPAPECSALLHKNIQINNCENVQVFEVAVTDRIGCTTLYPNSRNPSGSTTFEHYTTPSSHKDPQIQVPTITLDKAINNGKVDFVKMDIEGGEVKALRGMINIIRNNPNLKMIIEVYPKGLARIGNNFEEYVGFLQMYFELYLIGKNNSTNKASLQEIKNATRKAEVFNIFCQRKSIHA